MVEEYRVKVSRAYAKLIILLIPAVLLIGYLGAGLAARHAGLSYRFGSGYAGRSISSPSCMSQRWDFSAPFG